jgi:glycopeptide antibiotics resistance protein
MKWLAVLWLAGWAFVALPWRSFSPVPSTRNVQLVPFEDGRVMAHALNVAAFVPWGVIAGAGRWSATSAILSGAGISAATEVLQLFSRRRYPTTTDLVLNTAGAALGVGLSRLVRRSMRRSGGADNLGSSQ